MAQISFSHTGIFSVPVEELFVWHERAGAFVRLNPPWNPVKLISSTGGIREGAKVSITVPVGPFTIPWHLGHGEYQQNRLFTDNQISGPFRSWNHRHEFSAVDESSSKLTDSLQIELPRGVGFFAPLLKRDLRRLFLHRHKILELDLALHQRWHGKPKLRFLLVGASGLIGEALSAFLTTGGHTVFTLVRRKAKTENEISWDPENKTCGETPEVDVVVSLSGAGIADARWSPKRKELLHKSRVETTLFLSSLIAEKKIKTKTFLSASASGIYPSSETQVVDETSVTGKGFLAQLASDWEEATQAASQSGVRVVHLRTGVVLSPRGGALKKMWLPFLLGLGGKLGDGKQIMSWISLQDMLGAILHLSYKDECSGAFNMVAPNYVTNAEFTKVLGKVLKRPTVFSVPAFVMRMMFGEMAEAVLLTGRAVRPKKLIESGYQFLLPEIEGAIRFEAGLGSSR